MRAETGTVRAEVGGERRCDAVERDDAKARAGEVGVRGVCGYAVRAGVVALGVFGLQKPGEVEAQAAEAQASGGGHTIFATGTAGALVGAAAGESRGGDARAAPPGIIFSWASIFGESTQIATGVALQVLTKTKLKTLCQ